MCVCVCYKTWAMDHGARQTTGQNRKKRGKPHETALRQMRASECVSITRTRLWTARASGGSGKQQNWHLVWQLGMEAMCDRKQQHTSSQMLACHRHNNNSNNIWLDYRDGQCLLGTQSQIWNYCSSATISDGLRKNWFMLSDLFHGASCKRPRPIRVGV